MYPDACSAGYSCDEWHECSELRRLGYDYSILSGGDEESGIFECVRNGLVGDFFAGNAVFVVGLDGSSDTGVLGFLSDEFI